jgi:thioredoxin 1
MLAEETKQMASEKVQTFTDSNFDDSTKQGVVLVDFWAEWCGPCRRLAPTVEQLASDFDGRAVVGKLDVDANPSVAAKFQIRGIPTLLIFKDGQLADTVVGLASKEDLAGRLEQQLQ